MMAFRAPLPVEDYVKGRVAAGNKQTDVIIKMLETSMHLARTLGDDLYELDRRASVAGEHVGVVIARLVREGMKHSKK